MTTYHSAILWKGDYEVYCEVESEYVGDAEVGGFTCPLCGDTFEIVERLEVRELEE